MSWMNDFNITVLATDKQDGKEFSPVEINVDSVFQRKPLIDAGEVINAVESRKKASTRLDLKYPFNSNGRITTATGEYQGFKHQAQSALFVAETVNELNKKIEEARSQHFKTLLKVGFKAF